MALKDYISITEGFPKAGISFKDVSPLLGNPAAFKECVEKLDALARPYHPDLVIGPEARGFVFGAPLALSLGTGFVMARKKGKLPGKLQKADYQLEYGTDSLYVEEGLIKPGQKVVIVDDLLATGGTAKALVDLVISLKAEPVLVLAVVALTDFHGNDCFAPVPFESLVSYPH